MTRSIRTRANLLNFWDAADAMAICSPQEQRPIERPQMVRASVHALNPRKWPPCPCCGLSVNASECPQSAVDAAWKEMGK